MASRPCAIRAAAAAVIDVFGSSDHVYFLREQSSGGDVLYQYVPW